jgi:hypothetical protein
MLCRQNCGSVGQSDGGRVGRQEVGTAAAAAVAEGRAPTAAQVGDQEERAAAHIHRTYDAPFTRLGSAAGAIMGLGACVCRVKLCHIVDITDVVNAGGVIINQLMQALKL